VTAAPLFAGGVHLIVTVSGLNVVVGGDGELGTVAQSIYDAVEFTP